MYYIIFRNLFHQIRDSAAAALEAIYPIALKKIGKELSEEKAEEEGEEEGTEKKEEEEGQQ